MWAKNHICDIAYCVYEYDIRMDNECAITKRRKVISQVMYIDSDLDTHKLEGSTLRLLITSEFEAIIEVRQDIPSV